MTADALEAAPATFTAADVAVLMGRMGLLEELVKWLSLAYGDNEPTFAGADGLGTQDGRPLGHAPRLHTLWHQVMNRPHVEGMWDEMERFQCRECGQWQQRRP